MRQGAWFMLLPLLLLAACGEGNVGTAPWERTREAFPRPRIPWDPEIYPCPRATGTIEVDGKADETAWTAAPWTRRFVDIEGDRKPQPRHATRVKMLWDDAHLYVFAEMEEPHLQASFRKRDSYIFHEDNDFEVFLDPDGDTHDYFELEINAFGTEWDLFLDKPYRDGGQAQDEFDLAGLRTAVHLDGTINDPSDTDRSWGLEIQVPFAALGEKAGVPVPPRPDDSWRINFSRVQWRFVPGKGGGYVKEHDPTTGKPFPEDNWVWSPQGLISMHYPERWGQLVFLPQDAKEMRSAFNLDDAIKISLREIYYLQRGFKEVHGRYFTSEDRPPIPEEGVIRLRASETDFTAWWPLMFGRRMLIRSDGWVGRAEDPTAEGGR